MSNQDARWELELAIVAYEQSTPSERNFVPVQKAITELIRVVRQEALNEALEHPEDFDIYGG